MVPESVRERIQGELDALEAEAGVTIVYACESGSRAWGFASQNSDFDVRFLYVHPLDWYLSIDLNRRADTIDVPITDELDLHGWDVRKALGLFQKSNPPLFEWLQSPVVYREDGAVMERWRNLLPDYYTPRAAGYHYLHMAQGNFRKYLEGRERVQHKKYLYVLRPLLAIRWIESQDAPVPTEFARLVDTGTDDEALRDAIGRLIDEKESGAELDDGPRRPVLHDFIARELERLEGTRFSDETDRPPVEPLNGFFRDIVLQSEHR